MSLYDISYSSLNSFLRCSIQDRSSIEKILLGVLLAVFKVTWGSDSLNNETIVYEIEEKKLRRRTVRRKISFYRQKS